jgi:hypothetical protein
MSETYSPTEIELALEIENIAGTYCRMEDFLDDAVPLIIAYRRAVLDAALANAREALCDVRAGIIDVYGVNKHSIVDTVWVGIGVETAVDRIDAALASLEPKP